MRFFRFLRHIDRKFSLGLIVGILFGAAGLYVALLYERRPHLTLDVFSNAAILDVKEELGGLEILFNGVDIQESNQTLRILLVRIVNDGQVDLTLDSFDGRDLPGFEVAPGQIVQPPDVAEASNAYLRENVQIRQVSPSVIRLSPVIIERGQHITVKVLLLVPKDTVPQIQPVGKVAGVTSIPVSASFARAATPPFLARAFSGDIGVHLARLLAYAFVGVVLLIAGLVVGTPASDLLARRKRYGVVRQYLKGLSFEPHQAIRQLLDLYVSEGDTVLYLIANVSQDPRFLSRKSVSQKGAPIVEGATAVYTDTVFLAPDFSSLTRSLELAGVVEKRSPGHVLTREVTTFLPDFTKYLKSKGVLEEGLGSASGGGYSPYNRAADNLHAHLVPLDNDAAGFTLGD